MCRHGNRNDHSIWACGHSSGQFPPVLRVNQSVDDGNSATGCDKKKLNLDLHPQLLLFFNDSTSLVLSVVSVGADNKSDESHDSKGHWTLMDF